MFDSWVRPCQLSAVGHDCFAIVSLRRFVEKWLEEYRLDHLAEKSVVNFNALAPSLPHAYAPVPRPSRPQPPRRPPAGAAGTARSRLPRQDQVP